ncbi:hypothetical protein NHX12_002386 [Muraenolepis orangiensis]|uniref:Uncharacterized protein n=1 Tax=Muraenolepis orangiensis TaxID=630683 RepID=A0A9Q0ID09_9TELE|nr:hypothetical protein NHX12_002386 [Muraenolepis orangiensis]
MEAGILASLSKVSDREVFIDPYVQITFAGQQDQSVWGLGSPQDQSVWGLGSSQDQIVWGLGSSQDQSVWGLGSSLGPECLGSRVLSRTKVFGVSGPL